MEKIVVVLVPVVVHQQAITTTYPDFLFWFALAMNMVGIILIYGIKKLGWIERTFKPMRPPQKDSDSA